MPTGKFSIFFEIPTDSMYIGAPSSISSKNDLDAHGLLLGLRRLKGETGDEYYKRLRSVIPLRAGANQEGLVHGVTRELGLEEKIALKIEPLSFNGKYIASAPHVSISSTKIILYSKYLSETDYTVDVEVDIFDHGDGYLLKDLLAELQLASYFTAELMTGTTGEEKSCGLIPKESITIVEKEVVPNYKYFYLQNDDIVPGSLTFKDKITFETELSSEIADAVDGGVTLSFSVTTPVTSPGEYFVDYAEGVIESYLVPSDISTCRYAYRDFPLYAKWSPVSVYSLRDEEYREKIFEDEVALDDQTVDGLVTDEGRQVYSEIFNKAPSLWGK